MKNIADAISYLMQLHTKAFLFVQSIFWCNYIIAAKIALFTKYGGTIAVVGG